MAAIGAVLALLLTTRPGGSAEEEKRSCCFTNPEYSGVCQVDPAEGETCGSILAYLNKAMSTGKSYCSNTDIRGGWRLVKCK
jgi:hypothetical protein